jgi:alcohol dehydrogenase class IV
MQVFVLNCEHDCREAVLKPRIHFGGGKLAFLPEILATHKVRTVLLVSGKAAYSGSGAEQTLASLASEFEVVRLLGA